MKACSDLARAEEAKQEKSSEVSWYFLAKAEHQLGCAEGYYAAVSDSNMKQSRAVSGGKKKMENVEHNELKLYIQLLDELKPALGWESKWEAIKKVSSQAIGILAKLNRPAGDIYARLFDLLTANADVKAAFEKASRHGR